MNDILPALMPGVQQKARSLLLSHKTRVRLVISPQGQIKQHLGDTAGLKAGVSPKAESEKMKEKKRYILVQAEGMPADERLLKTAAYDAVFEWLGDKGVSEARVQFIRAETTPEGQKPASGRFWIKCSTKSLENIVAALALKRFFNGKDAALRVIKVAGSVPRLEKKNNPKH